MKLLSLIGRFSPQVACLSGMPQGNGQQELNESMKETMRTKEDLQTECATPQLDTSNLVSVKLDKVTLLVAQTAMKNLLSKDYFSICRLDSVMEITRCGDKNHPMYKKLHALHCVDYAEMPKELKLLIPSMINEILMSDVTGCASDIALAGIYA